MKVTRCGYCREFKMWHD